MNKIALRLAAIPAAALAAAGSAHAALPAGVTDAITTFQTDTTSAIGAVMGAGVVIWGLRRLGQKMGWL